MERCREGFEQVEPPQSSGKITGLLLLLRAVNTELNANFENIPVPSEIPGQLPRPSVICITPFDDVLYTGGLFAMDVPVMPQAANDRTCHSVYADGITVDGIPNLTVLNPKPGEIAKAPTVFVKQKYNVNEEILPTHDKVSETKKQDKPGQSVLKQYREEWKQIISFIRKNPKDVNAIISGLYPLIKKIVRSRVFIKQIQEDIIQRVAAGIWQQRQNILEGFSSVSDQQQAFYILSVIDKQIADALKKENHQRKKGRLPEEAYYYDLEQYRASGRATEDHLFFRELFEAIEDFKKMIISEAGENPEYNSRLKILPYLFNSEEISKEIAQQLKMNLNTAYNAKRLLRKDLKAFLKKRFGNEVFANIFETD